MKFTLITLNLQRSEGCIYNIQDLLYVEIAPICAVFPCQIHSRCTYNVKSIRH